MYIIVDDNLSYVTDVREKFYVKGNPKVYFVFGEKEDAFQFRNFSVAAIYAKLASKQMRIDVAVLDACNSDEILRTYCNDYRNGEGNG